MIAEMLNSKHVDEVMVVPCGDRADKNIEAGSHRLEMVKIAIQEYFSLEAQQFIKLDEREIRNGKMIPTYFLMKDYQKESPKDIFYCVVGADLIPGLHLWNEGVKFKQEIPFMILERGGYQIDPSALPPVHVLVRNVADFTSSTIVRERLKAARAAKAAEPGAAQSLFLLYLGCYGLLPTAVLEYIKKHNLYP